MATHKSLGEALFDSLKKQQSTQEVMQINSLTGEKSTAKDNLTIAVAVAAGIRKLGLVPDDLVAVVSNFSTNSIAACIGGLLQGVAIYPMDPSLKQLELEHMFEHAKPKLVFTMSKTAISSAKALKVLKNEAPIYLLDEEHGVDVRKQFSVFKFSDILNAVDPQKFECTSIDRPDQRIALVIPSSGTTGFSKGVAITHNCALFQLRVWEKVPVMVDRQVLLQLTPLFWVSGLQLLIFSTLFACPRVYVTEVTSKNILSAIQNYKPKWGIFAPIFLAWTLADPEFNKYDLSSLESIIAGGSVLPQATVASFEKKLPRVRLFQAYGASEIFGIITKPFHEGDILSAGTPIDHVEVRVVDINTREEVGPGKEGEILIKSKDSMMKCYLNNEESTKNAIDSNGFFKTGDVGYIDELNYIYITSRIKELIKVKNHQVSPYEIEEVINHLAGVKDVAVVGIPHEIDQYHPRALVVKSNDSPITESDITNAVADQLSETKQLLAGVQFVTEIPRNPSGKIKRGELPKLVKM